MNIEEIKIKELEMINKFGYALVFAGSASGNLGNLVGQMILKKIDEKAVNKKIELYQNVVTLPFNSEKAKTSIHDFLNKKGAVINDEGDASAEYSSTTYAYTSNNGIIIKDVLIRVVIIPKTDTTCDVVFSGTAREGIAKTHTAEKVIGKLLSKIV